MTIDELYKRIEDVPDFYGHTIDNVNYRNSIGDCPLHIVSVWGNCEAINLLIEHGADIDAKGEGEYTPLHYAVEQNHIDAVKLLVTHGASTNVAAEGDTIMDIAKTMKYEEIIFFLSSLTTVTKTSPYKNQ